MSVTILIGLLGSLLYFTSYALLTTRKVDGNSYTYIGMNLTAALCVIISLTTEWNLPSFIIQSVWCVLSVYGLYGVYRSKKGAANKPVQ